jgi:hypothetical protein
MDLTVDILTCIHHMHIWILLWAYRHAFSSYIYGSYCGRMSDLHQFSVQGLNFAYVPFTHTYIYGSYRGRVADLHQFSVQVQCIYSILFLE